MLMLTLDPPRPFTKPNPRSPQRLNGRSLSPHNSYRTPRPTSPSLGHPLSILSLLFIYLLFIYISIIDSFIDFFFIFIFIYVLFPPFSPSFSLFLLRSFLSYPPCFHKCRPWTCAAPTFGPHFGPVLKGTITQLILCHCLLFSLLP